MNKVLLVVVAMVVTFLSVDAQVKVESPHPDLKLSIKQCLQAGESVEIELIITNYGSDMSLEFCDVWISAHDDEGYSYDFKNSKIVCGRPNSKLMTRNIFSFPQDIPVRIKFIISKVNKNSSEFALLKIGSRTEANLIGPADRIFKIKNLGIKK